MNRLTIAAKNSPLVQGILRGIAILSLVYYTWMMVDLVTHPFAAGSNALLVPYLFRWLSAACGTFTVLVAVFILRRAPGNFLGLLLVIFGVGAAGWSQRIDLGSVFWNNLALVVFNTYFFFLAFPSLSALLFHFPSGQVYPARFTVLAWGLVLFQALVGMVSILGVPAFQNGKISNIMYIPALQPVAIPSNLLMVLVAPPAAILSLVLRYRAGGEGERLQIKWLVWLAGMALMISIISSTLLPYDLAVNSKQVFPQLLKIFTFLYWQIFPAAAIGIALLRYRLWDIDIIIRRTLLYSALTVSLGSLYFGSVVLLQQVFGRLTGESTLAIVLSTLFVAALFEPVRRRIQSFINRRFYRQKYDASLALEEFSSSARQEVELGTLTNRIIMVVDNTLQPEQVSVWLRDGGNQA